MPSGQGASAHECLMLPCNKALALAATWHTYNLSHMDASSAPGLLDLLGGHFPGHTMQRMRLPDGRYRYTYVSPGVRETFGLDPAALLAAESVAHDWIPEPDRGRFVAALERSAVTLETLDQEVRVTRRDGAVRWVRSIGHPRRLPDGAVLWDGVALDVTDRHEAKAALDAALDLAKRREVSGSGLAAIALRDLQRPLADLRREVETLRAPAVLTRLAEFEAALASALTLLRAAREDSPEDVSLTGRQAEIHALLRDGLSNRDIARRLGIGEGTVKLHVSAILRRLGARNRTEAALRA